MPPAFRAYRRVDRAQPAAFPWSIVTLSLLRLFAHLPGQDEAAFGPFFPASSSSIRLPGAHRGMRPPSRTRS